MVRWPFVFTSVLCYKSETFRKYAIHNQVKTYGNSKHSVVLNLSQKYKGNVIYLRRSIVS